MDDVISILWRSIIKSRVRLIVLLEGREGVKNELSYKG